MNASRGIFGVGLLVSLLVGLVQADQQEEKRFAPNQMGAEVTQSVVNLVDVQLISQDDGVVLRLSGDGDFVYNTITLANPYRVVLDLTGVKEPLAVNTPTGHPFVKSVRYAVFHPSKTEAVIRYVLQTGTRPVYEVKQIGNFIEMTVKPSGVLETSSNSHQGSGNEGPFVSAQSGQNDDTYTLVQVEKPAVRQNDDDQTVLPLLGFFKRDRVEESVAGDDNSLQWTETEVDDLVYDWDSRSDGVSGKYRWGVSQDSDDCENWITPGEPVRLAERETDMALNESQVVAFADIPPAVATDEVSAPIPAPMPGIRVAENPSDATDPVDTTESELIAETDPEAAVDSSVESADEIVDEPTGANTPPVSTESEIVSDPQQAEDPFAPVIAKHKGAAVERANREWKVASKRHNRAPQMGDADPDYTFAEGQATLPPMSMDVQGAEIHTILRSIAEYSGANIVADSNVKGAVTIRVIDLPWQETLRTVCQALSLVPMNLDGDVIRVATARTAQDEAVAQESSERKKEEVMPLKTRIIPLEFANAAEMKTIVHSVRSGRGNVDVDDRTNSLIMTDITPRLDLVEKMLKDLDTETLQVEITAELVDVDATLARELGIAWDLENLHSSSNNMSGIGSIAAEDVVDPVGMIQTGVIRDFGTIKTRLQALETENKADIISTPRITTVNNRTARILVGKEVPLITLDQAGNLITELKKVGITLEAQLGKPDPKAIEKDMSELLGTIVSKIRHREEVEIHCDEHPAYPRAARRLKRESPKLPAVSLKTISSKAARTFRNPLFSINRIDMLIRHCSANHKRETIAFSKLRQRAAERLAILMVYLNEIKRQREKGPPVSPAMILGVRKQRFTWKELLSRRRFPKHAELVGRWREYYWGKVKTLVFRSKQRPHQLIYAR